MQRQGSFSQAEYAGKKKQTRRDKFLAEMEQVVPPAFAGAGLYGPFSVKLHCRVRGELAVVRASARYTLVFGRSAGGPQP
jgi:hypothetical protein